MLVLRNDMTKGEIQSVVEIMLNMSSGDLSKLHTDTLIKMHNGLTENLRAYHVLADEVAKLNGELAQAPLVKVKPRKYRDGKYK